ncbi:hypothetical protein K469DRAFT_12799 [Zopfia rhizophila CBS 207.26]|uniref:Uncharacterized protein n=1 Tax=Zopfia rhizophila CBS 207.26 TaxID=1314779 RepID=A0A6A6EWY1_9PEZI|nr:hypothetical protein K469DRAFT_12799 [Zopfia rhizophila CBS 207.26]
MCAARQNSNIFHRAIHSRQRYLKENGVMNLIDFFSRLNHKIVAADIHSNAISGKTKDLVHDRTMLKEWLVWRVEYMRGEIEVDLEVFLAFNCDPQ